MGNCVKRETGLDIEDTSKQEELNTQEMINKVLTMKKDWKNRAERNEMQRSAIINRNNIMNEIDLSDMDESIRKTMGSTNSKKGNKRGSKISKRFEEDEGVLDIKM